jgi:predicted ATPase
VLASTRSRTVFDAAAARRPLLLAIDDLHLIDRESLELLEELQRRASRHPFGVLAAARPGDLSGLAPRLRRIDVGPLDLAWTVENGTLRVFATPTRPAVRSTDPP